VSVDQLAPFGRGTDAPLAGRTILQIVPPVAAGGDEQSTLAVAAALVEVGARALVASDPGEMTSELQAIGGLHVPFPSAAKNPVAISLNLRRLARIIRSERVEIVHARSRAAAWAALTVCRELKRPLVTSFHGESSGSDMRKSFESAVAGGDLVIASSQYAAERAARIFPLAQTRLRIVRPGIDLARLDPGSVDRERVARIREAWGAAEHIRVALTPSRLAPGRGQRTLIEAASLLRSRGLNDIRFVLAGDAAQPAFARELDALAVERGVDSIVARTGPPSDRPAAFIGAAVAVFPASDPEAPTRSALEAAAMGALTIVSDVGPAREIVAAPRNAGAESGSGWLVRPGDAIALANAIEAAMTLGAAAREAARRRLRARIGRHYSIERMTRDTLSVYAEALRR
jgi:glycosyltransferase involved in cell wall biosynthesis